MKNQILGNKIKILRKKRGLTQKELAGDKITRNMLSSIENGMATPSVDTLIHIASGLNISVAYLLSEENDLPFFEKIAAIDKIYRAYEAKNYQACINLINSLSETDSELNYFLASSYLELGKLSVMHGSLLSAVKQLDLSQLFCEKTKIDTKHIQAQIPLYKAIAKNVQSPLLEFDSRKYTDLVTDSVDYEFFKYLTLDFSYTFTMPVYSLHMEAKVLMKERNYTEAIKRLLNAVELSKNQDYNSYVIFSLYTDLENCYKQLYNFENAYLYSNKRITLLESFKS